MAGARLAEHVEAVAEKDFEFAQHDYVGIHGLSKAIHLNGKSGYVDGYDPVTQRYMIQVEDLDDSVKVKGHNLVMMGSSADERDSDCEEPAWDLGPPAAVLPNSPSSSERAPCARKNIRTTMRDEHSSSASSRRGLCSPPSAAAVPPFGGPPPRHA